MTNRPSLSERAALALAPWADPASVRLALGMGSPVKAFTTRPSIRASFLGSVTAGVRC
jgi:hypothetical protein